MVRFFPKVLPMLATVIFDLLLSVLLELSFGLKLA